MLFHIPFGSALCTYFYLLSLELILHLFIVCSACVSSPPSPSPSFWLFCHCLVILLLLICLCFVFCPPLAFSSFLLPSVRPPFGFVFSPVVLILSRFFFLFSLKAGVGVATDWSSFFRSAAAAAPHLPAVLWL